jgi:uncharacterized protein with GYD domain
MMVEPITITVIALSFIITYAIRFIRQKSVLADTIIQFIDDVGVDDYITKEFYELMGKYDKGNKVINAIKAYNELLKKHPQLERLMKDGKDMS